MKRFHSSQENNNNNNDNNNNKDNRCEKNHFSLALKMKFGDLVRKFSLFRSKKKSNIKIFHLKRTNENINLLLTKGCGVTVHDDGRGNITESFADFRVKKEKYQSQNSMLDLL